MTNTKFDITAQRGWVDHLPSSAKGHSFDQALLAIDSEGTSVGRFWWRWTRGGTCQCIVQINGIGRGYGKAGGYGYDKKAQALDNALASVGIKWKSAHDITPDYDLQTMFEELDNKEVQVYWV